MMVTSEAAPFAKTGGLADVLGSLPPALVEKGEEVVVVLPAYGTIDLRGAERIYDQLTVWLDSGRYDCAIDRIRRHGVPLPVRQLSGHLRPAGDLRRRLWRVR